MSSAHPPATDFFVASGVHHALEPYLGGFAVSDGHHNRVLWVRRDGTVRQLVVVPTGLAPTERGCSSASRPRPASARRRQDGRAHALAARRAGRGLRRPAGRRRRVRLTPWPHVARDVASGAPLVVDVEPDHGLYALAQRVWALPDDPANAGAPASPNTGSLVRVERAGNLPPIVGPRPADLGGVRRHLTGKVLRIDGDLIPPRRPMTGAA